MVLIDNHMEDRIQEILEVHIEVGTRNAAMVEETSKEAMEEETSKEVLEVETKKEASVAETLEMKPSLEGMSVSSNRKIE